MYSVLNEICDSEELTYDSGSLMLSIPLIDPSGLISGRKKLHLQIG